MIRVCTASLIRRFRVLSVLLAAGAALAAGSVLPQSLALAQNKVRTETIQVTPQVTAPGNAAAPSGGSGARSQAPAGGAHAVRPGDAKGGESAPPEVITDLSRLPEPVARMRARILEAARSGSLEKLATVMQSNELMPIFTFGNDRDPIALWQASFPDSKGVEVLGILLDVMEAPFVHVDQGTPQEMFIWPYFARYPIRNLDPEQLVELFRIVTGSDYRDMVEFGAYAFYRVGIAPDGVWHFFVAGE
ncbi:hypothetical protein BLTE_09870 [Blastochloris tepida]|uniref:Lipoprotein n=1 Tax=Blastochloris tepida TaxID=2233851 RepID=A0A348FYB9_9HYPH|nr:hypothetical protein BLTE_09870 [Blastochloris tepida]